MNNWNFYVTEEDNLGIRGGTPDVKVTLAYVSGCADGVQFHGASAQGIKGLDQS